MILLRHDCLVFKTANGDQIPCSAQEITVELMGDFVEMIDPDMLKNAAHAVLHYFKTELGRTTVSVGEFSQALETVLRKLGLAVAPSEGARPPLRIMESDLCRLAGEQGESCELLFFTRLREELRRHLGQSPHIVRFHGLDRCVKRLAGAKRWSAHCRKLHQQIVEYLRTCLKADQEGAPVALVVS